MKRLHLTLRLTEPVAEVKLSLTVFPFPLRVNR